jgi:hypothetical protein
LVAGLLGEQGADLLGVGERSCSKIARAFCQCARVWSEQPQPLVDDAEVVQAGSLAVVVAHLPDDCQALGMSRRS